MAREKSNLVLAALFLITIFSSGVFAGTYSGGSGEPNDPYLIATAEDLNDIGNHVEDFNKCFLMVADINLADYTGTQFNIIGEMYPGREFTGVFDGNGHTIFNFTYATTDAYLIGLFGYVNQNAEIKNLTLINPNINAAALSESISCLVSYLENGTISGCGVEGGSVSGNSLVGGLVGYNDSGTIINCYFTGSVSGNSLVGGLVGYNDSGTIINCYFTGSVSGGNCHTGGLVGYNDYYSTISNCYAMGSVSGGNCHTGGLVGYNGESTILNCYATGTVTGGNCYTGGLVGYNDYYSKISNCYATGSVSGDGYTGGLVGINYYQCTISDCYATGSVSGSSDVGGLMGDNYRSQISNCYATGNVSGVEDAGGLVGDHYMGTVLASFWDIETSGQTTSDGGEGKTTAEMKTESTFTDANWDFIEIWDIGENQTYPFLRVYPAGDINHDDIVNFHDLAILADHWLQKK